jgi:hypothetical protein
VRPARLVQAAVLSHLAAYQVILSIFILI